METYVIGIAKQALILIIILSAPAVFVSLAIGLSVSLFQATTQIQDQTLTFVPKLIGVTLTLVVFGTWGAGKAITFASRLLSSFPELIQ